MWFDSHCHVQWSEGVDATIERARQEGVVAMIVVGTDGATSRAAVDLAARHPDVWATVGLHPHDASAFVEQWPELEQLTRADRVVAVGEAGFDLHYRHSEPDAQEAAFRAQIRSAHELDHALVIHSREAWDETFRVLADEGPPPRTVFHCFTGGPEEARRALDLGAHLSFSGIVSFPNADDVRAAAAICPADRVLVETDAPYLTPVPHRGKENEPAYVVHVGEALAEARGEPADEVARATTANARNVFGLVSGP
ncbi:MAG: TatD family deoxyribonuclease [Actinobacteria bacterium]|nr:TatD family deoxyribonuclease [Actinomycetota bacterium]